MGRTRGFPHPLKSSFQTRLIQLVGKKEERLFFASIQREEALMGLLDQAGGVQDRSSEMCDEEERAQHAALWCATAEWWWSGEGPTGRAERPKSRCRGSFGSLSSVTSLWGMTVCGCRCRMPAVKLGCFHIHRHHAGFFQSSKTFLLPSYDSCRR